MEKADDSATAHALWVATNNTVGFNHMVASAPDAALYAAFKPYLGPGVAVAMETMFNYTAFFTDNDPREANAIYTPNGSSTGTHIGISCTLFIYIHA